MSSMSSVSRRKVIYDTNVYIRAIRHGPGSRDYSLLQSSVPSTYLASVVSAELNVGAQDPIGVKLVRQFLTASERVGRVIVPTYASWNQAGQILAAIYKSQPRYRSKLPALFNDALLVMCALQIGASLCTSDKEDFELLHCYRKFDFIFVDES
jgi:predicted nucleic acid-binding protein